MDLDGFGNLSKVTELVCGRWSRTVSHAYLTSNPMPVTTTPYCLHFMLKTTLTTNRSLSFAPHASSLCYICFSSSCSTMLGCGDLFSLAKSFNLLLSRSPLAWWLILGFILQQERIPRMPSLSFVTTKEPCLQMVLQFCAHLGTARVVPGFGHSSLPPQWPGELMAEGSSPLSGKLGFYFISFPGTSTSVSVGAL